MTFKKSYIWTFLAGAAVPVILFFVLFFKGCFGGATFTKPFPQDPLAVKPDSTTAELAAKPLSVEGKNIITRWKTPPTDTIVKEIHTYHGGDCEDFEHEDTITRKQTITIKQGSKRTDYAVEENLPFKQIVGCSVGRSLLTFGASHSEIEIPETRPISRGQSIVSVKPFFEFDLVNEKAWKVGARFYVNLDPLGIYISPNANPEHALSLPVGIDYKVWEK